MNIALSSTLVTSLGRPLGSPKFRLLVLFVFGGLIFASASGCKKSYPNCDDDETCRAKGEVCVDSRCRECREDHHCTRIDACMTCSANECVKRPGCCKSNLDCSSSEKCLRDPSNPSGPGTCGECDPRNPCPEGSICSQGKCMPDVCTDDGFCPTGTACINGRCTRVACNPEPVYFDFNEYAIRLDMEAVVQSNAECIISRDQKFRVEGHCDERGSDEYNLALGQRRAAGLVRQYGSLGVPRPNLSTISYGEESPVCSESRESCWRQNRRVETAPRQ